MRRLLRLLGAVALVAAVVWATQAVDLTPYLNEAEMQRLVAAHAPYGPLVFMALCMAGILLTMPELLIIMAGAPAFGPVATFVYAWTACVLGTIISFSIARFVAHDHFQRLLVQRFPRLLLLDQRLERHGFATVLVLRLLFILAPPLNWGLGATRVRLRDYVAGTAVGIVPWVAAAVLVGPWIMPERPGEPWLTWRLAVVGACIVAVASVVAILGRRLFGGMRVAPPG